MRFPRVLLASITFLTGLAFTGCERGPTTTAADVEAINLVREGEVAGMNAGDVDGMLDIFTDDCEFLPPNEPRMTGHEAVRSWFEGFLEQFEVSGKYTASDVVVAGDYAIERYAGTFTITPKAGGEPIEEMVKGIHIYKRQPDGTWRIAQDVWNSDNPPMVAQ